MLQTVLFDRSLWTLASAKKWLTYHKLINRKVDIEKNYYRFRQIPPNKNTRYYSKRVADGVIFVFMR